MFLAASCKAWALQARLRLPLRSIHARASQMPLGEQQRRATRLKELFRDPAASKVVLSPTTTSSPGRSNAAARIRKSIQLSQTADELLLNVSDALKCGCVDASVFGAAMQRCGQGRWWQTLLAVAELQREAGVPLFWVETTIYFTALVKAARGEAGFGIDSSRQLHVLELARQGWSEQDVGQVNAEAIGAALNVCSTAAHGNPALSEEALSWANELIRTAKEQKVSLTLVQFTQYAQVLELSGQSDYVDTFLRGLRSSRHGLDSVALSTLVNIAAESKSVSRATKLWKLFTEDLHVEPGITAYCALAKSFLLSGKPMLAARIMNDMCNNGTKMNVYAVTMQVQATLIIYHSSLSEEDGRTFLASLKRGRSHFTAASTSHQRDFHLFKGISQLLHDKPQSVRFKEVLIDWNAQRSEMKTWDNFEAGSNYLKHFDSGDWPVW